MFIQQTLIVYSTYKMYIFKLNEYVKIHKRIYSEIKMTEKII